MKRFKKTITLFVAAVMCMMCFLNNSAFASAEEEHVTYYLKYVTEKNEWRFQKDTWSDTGYHRELYYMHQDLKDGDLIVIDGPEKIELTVDVQLGNLTLLNTKQAVVYAKGYDVVHILNNSEGAVNGDVKYAEVYHNTKVNFNNNVEYLKVLNPYGGVVNTCVYVGGTLGHLYYGAKDVTFIEAYNFEAGSLYIEYGELKTDASKYTTTPPATTNPPANNNSNNSNEYDEVPKTGDSRFNPLWLVGLAAVCMLGAYKLKERY